MLSAIQYAHAWVVSHLHRDERGQDLIEYALLGGLIALTLMAWAENLKERPDWEAFVALWREREKRAAPAEEFTSPTRMEGHDKVSRLLYHREDEPQAPDRAAAVGTACHAVLERLDFKAPAIPEGTDPEAAEILEAFFKTAVFKDLAGSELLARELPFLLPRGGRIVQGVIDVVYRRGGKTYVADYKTDKMMKPEEHALIRDVYTEAVERALKIKPSFKLIYLRHGREVEP